MPLSTQQGFSDKELTQCKGWMLPDVSNGDEIPASVAKKNNQKNTQINETDTSPNNKKDSIETIEDVDLETIPESAPAISAEELQAITDAAEKEGYQAGYEKGLKQGETEGLAKGLEDAKQTVIDQSERLQHIIDVLLAPLESEKDKIESVLVDLVCKLTQTVIERELAIDSRTIEVLIDSVLTQLPQSISNFTLYLNPNDIELVETHLQQKELSVIHEMKKQYSIVSDENLLPGGCRLESKKTNIDASIETKIKKVLQDFLQKKHVTPDENLDDELSDDQVNDDQVEKPQENTLDDSHDETAT